MSGPSFYTPAVGVQNREEFRAMLARLGIDSHIVTDASGGLTVALERAGMERLAAWFADHGDAAQADAVRRGLSG